MNLLIQRTTIGPCPIMSVGGELDLSTVPELHAALNRIVHEHPGARLVVDLDGITACDDAGLGVLLGAAGRSREGGGDLVVVSSQGRLRSRLARTGFDRAVDIYASINEAVGD